MDEAFVNSWKTVHLRDHIYKPEYGFTTSATNDLIGPRFLRITDIQDEMVDWETVPYCECRIGKDRYLLKSGDIVVARIGATTGKTYLIENPPEAIFASYLIRIRTKETLLPEYLNLFFQTENYWKQIDQNKGGRLKGGVNLPILQNLVLPFPPLPEQRAIAHVLCAVQHARETRLNEIALERERKAALMEHLFRHGTRGEATKQTEIGVMPESWKVSRLGDIITLHRGFDLPQKDRLPGNVPIISSSGITGTHAKAKINGPGVVTGRYGTIGEVFYISQDFWPLNTTLYVSEFNGNYPLFISYFLQTINLSSFNDKTSVPGINRNHIHALTVALPTIQEQQAIAKILVSCNSKIVALEHESTLLDELFKAMLEELMTGRLSAKGLIEATA